MKGVPIEDLKSAASWKSDMLGLTAAEIAKALSLDEQLIKNLFIKAGVKEIRPSKESYTRTEVYQLIEYLIDKSAMDEARTLIGYEKCVEFQLIPDRMDPKFQEPTIEEIMSCYVPEPWGTELNYYLLFNEFFLFGQLPDRECYQVFCNVRDEFRKRKLISH